MKKLDCLLSDTKETLQWITSNTDFIENFVLVGGSALTIHLCHRKSEDLDFFSYLDYPHFNKIINELGNNFKTVLLNQNVEQIDLLLKKVKVTFFNAKWNFLKPEVIEKFNIAPVEIIAGMKVNALFFRAKYRDYYDLYTIHKNGMNLRRIYESAKLLLPGINYKLFAAALLFVDDIIDDNINHLKPTEIISKYQIANYFETILRKEIIS